jgi:hypothetical protein
MLPQSLTSLKAVYDKVARHEAVHGKSLNHLKILDLLPEFFKFRKMTMTSDADV